MGIQVRLTRLLLLASVLAGACEKESSETGQLGELGRVAFSYRRSCFFGCPLAQPLLSGTRERIDVSDPGDVEGLRARSSDRDVAEVALERDCFCARADDVGGRIEVAADARCAEPRVKHCDNTVLVQARATGDAALELRDAQGALVDRAPLLVREAERARFRGTLASHVGASEAMSFELPQGDTLSLELDLFDARDQVLLAPEGVHWTSSDPAVAAVRAFLQPGGAALETGLEVFLNAGRAGDTEVGVVVPGLETFVQVHVTQR